MEVWTADINDRIKYKEHSDPDKWEYTQWSPDQDPLWDTWNEQQKKNALMFVKLLDYTRDIKDTPEWKKRLFDEIFHPDFKYVNASRPDMNDREAFFHSSLTNLPDVFRPYIQVAKAIVPRGDTEIWTYNALMTRFVAESYMGVKANGRSLYLEWYTIANFKEGRIVRIFSTTDVLSMMLVPLGILPQSALPIAPYKK